MAKNLYKNEKAFFSGMSEKNFAEDSHLITTDNPTLIDMGLAAFTTGALYDWLHTTNAGISKPFDYGDAWQEAFDNSDIEQDTEDAQREINQNLHKKIQSYPNLNLFTHALNFKANTQKIQKSPPQLFFSLQNYNGYAGLDDGSCGSVIFTHNGTAWRLDSNNCSDGCIPPDAPANDDLTADEQASIDKEGSVSRFNVPCEQIPHAIKDDIGTEKSLFNGSFLAWRNIGRNGRYEQYNIVDDSAQKSYWRFDEGEEVFTLQDLDLDFFQGATQIGDGDLDAGVGVDRGVRFKGGSLYTNPELIDVEVDGKTIKAIVDNNPNIGELDYSLEPNVNAWVDKFTPDKSYRFIQVLIEMNNYVNLLIRFKKSINQPYKYWSKTEKARYRFIEDIKSSKNGCFEWQSDIGFILDIDILTACVVFQKVKFKLYLYDESTKKDSSRKIAQKEPVFIAPKRTQLGIEYKERDEQGITPKSVNPSPNNETAAPLSTHYVPLTNSFESGTTQVFAIMLEDLASAEQPSLEDILDEDADVLMHPDTGFGPKIGKAVVVSMQNGNPKQWMPDFRLPKHCRGENKSKNIVTVHNPTDASFRKGQNVMLQKIDGVWIPSLIPKDPLSTALVPANPKWNFMYLMTNSTYFFKNQWWMWENNLYGPDTTDSNWRNDLKITPENYEKSFYRAYYNAQEGQGTQFNDTHPKIIQVDDNITRYGEEFDKQAKVVNGYFQVTSWDFMGVNIGGTRRTGWMEGYVDLGSEAGAMKEEWINIEDGDVNAAGQNGNALSNTQFSFNSANEPYENDGKGGQWNSYPFFGCVFPEGYNGAANYAVLMNEEKDFFLTPKKIESKVEYFNPPTTAQHFYAFGSDQLPFENINNVKRAPVEGYGLHQELGMFGPDENGTLKHLPADIATNASPQGLNGSPLNDIRVIGALNYSIGGDLRGQVGNYFKKNKENEQPERWTWMHKKDLDKVDEPITTGNINDFEYAFNNSAFDIQPNNPLKIEFRPLNLEVYAAFEGFKLDGPSYSYDFKFDASPNGRGEFAEEVYSVITKSWSAISPQTLVRNYNEITLPQKINGENVDKEKRLSTLYGSGDGLVSGPNERGLRYNKDIAFEQWDFLPDDITHAPQQFWDENWMGIGIGRPAGGIGVIGACVTVATRDTLQFHTENALGLDNYLESQTGPLRYGRSWRDGDYSSQNTTNLYARVFQQWPREQTIHDPRFFAVHHFNPGVEKANFGEDDSDIQKDWFISGVQVENDDPDLDKVEAGYPDGKFQVDRKEFSVDFRIPTFHNGNEVTTANENEFVFSDSVETELKKEGATGISALRKNKEHWRVNPQRRGKLLPYSYKFLTIGIPKVLTTAEINYSDLEEGADPITVSPLEFSAVIIEGGSKYKEKDTFELSGGEGGGVVLTPILGDDGKIVNFKVVDTGTLFAPDDFLASDDELTFEVGKGFGASSLKIVPRELQSEGTGLDAYILRGAIVQTNLVTDIRPKEALSAKGPIKLTPSPPLYNERLLQTQLTDSKNQSFDVDVNSKSDNDQYDIFLHFHNDISHTKISQGVTTTGPKQMEQMSRLQILTNAGGAGSTANSLTSNSSEDAAGFGFAPGEGPDQFAGNDNIINSDNPDGLGGMIGGFGDMLGGLGGGFGGGRGF